MIVPHADALAQVWPLFGLRVCTPRLTLTPLRDDDLPELVEVVRAGVHAPERMPFVMPWTDAPPDEIVGNTLRFHWAERARSVPDDWVVAFVVRSEGRIQGIQELRAAEFASRRVVGTGSWLGRMFQGQGVGREMRAAVLMFAFDHLGATRAETAAFDDNPASRRVSEVLGYRGNGTGIVRHRPGQVILEHRFVLEPADLRRPAWPLRVDGLGACRAEFGV